MGTARVLVVDDNRDAPDTLAAVADILGHDARPFYDGPSALAAVDGFRPDVCFLDLRMPGMDGFALATSLRQVLGSAAVLVAVTGEYGPDVAPRATAAGFDKVLTKPADTGALAEVLTRAAGK